MAIPEEIREPEAEAEEETQKEAIEGREDEMEENAAGGYSFTLDDWRRAERFLVLGCAEGSYYASAKELTISNAEAILSCIEEDPTRLIDLIVKISTSGRAAKNDPALFALALVATQANVGARKKAMEALLSVARIGTHLHHFCSYVNKLGSFGKVIRRGLQRWFASKDIGKLALLMLKYPSRDGWSFRDTLRMAHPKPDTEARDALYKWVVDGMGEAKPDNKGAVREKDGKTPEWMATHLPELVTVCDELKRETDLNIVCAMIREYHLPREVVPTELLKEVAVWEALFEDMPMTAMIRNLGKMSSLKMFGPGSARTATVCERLTDSVILKRARVHPIQMLQALVTYKVGAGFRGSLTWEPSQRIVDALDEGFYKSFDTLIPTGKRVLLALDVSGSMSWSPCNGLPGLTAATISACMSMVSARTEQNWEIMGFADTFRPLRISPGQRLDTVMKKVQINNFGGTDCALPMTWALRNGHEFDLFVVYTDGETWAGHGHPSKALKNYRSLVPEAKLVVVAVTATEVSIADPKDPGMLDIAGFDTAAPEIISSFARGQL